MLEIKPNVLEVDCTPLAHNSLHQEIAKDRGKIFLSISTAPAASPAITFNEGSGLHECTFFGLLGGNFY